VSFLGHLAQMALAMMAGMAASAAVFTAALTTTVDDALRELPVEFMLTQALGMTAAMVLWMRFRRHAWRSCSEMAAVTAAPLLPLVSLRLSGAVAGPSVCGFYCVSTAAAMVVLMLCRRREYGRAR
jgi:hypothetical protein